MDKRCGRVEITRQIDLKQLILILKAVRGDAKNYAQDCNAVKSQKVHLVNHMQTKQSNELSMSS